ncbi:MAG: hypothetical protein KAX65_11365 [Caldilineaceae bacterium]|nr:hypothetical protein [Caldilineaceae bacterium]
MRTYHKLVYLLAIWVLLLTTLQPVAVHAQADDDAARAAAVKALYMPERVPFYTDDGTWEVGEGEAVARSVAAGAYRLRIDAEDTLAWSVSELQAADFYLEAATIHVGGPLNNEFGVIFRYQDDDNFYSYSVSSDGYYRLDRKLAGEWSSLVSWTASSAINTGAASFNLLGVLAEGDRLALFVNETLLTALVDDAFAEGGIGPTAGSYDEGGVEIAYDDLSLWRIDEENRVAGQGLTLDTPPATTPTFDPVTVDPERIDAARAAEPIFSDRFRRDDGVWLTGAFDDMTATVRSGGLHLAVTAPQLVGWSSADVSVDDFLLEVDASIDDPNLPGQVGVFFRKVDDGNYYYFAIEQGGNFGLWKKVENNWSTLIDWTPSSAIATDAVNRLGVWAEGSTIALFVNDLPLAQVTDDAFASGVIAVAAGTFAEPELTAVFDDVAVWGIGE